MDIGSSAKDRLHSAPALGYTVEDVRPRGEIEKFHCPVYCNFIRKPS
ncbi:hypothetical protein KP509_34G041300 [Ceratopteris richardii]|uniref:Uncharacterized protein n=1 Tax=Ceratopteris richardii TaxID=49495 RepID=A0A8T2QJ86_CERRI|nr:hypothetical protein KP509_34G041300 [Ceratopteris richardii]